MDGQGDSTDEGRISRFSVYNFHIPSITTIIGDMGESLEYSDSEGISDTEAETLNEAGVNETPGHVDVDDNRCLNIAVNPVTCAFCG